MRTLTITDAKKNLGKWLAAAARGEEIGIIAGSQIFAIAPVEVRTKNWWDKLPVDEEYLRSEYGLEPEQAEKALARRLKEIDKDRSAGKLIAVPDNPEEALEKIARLTPARAKAAARDLRARRGRGRVRAA